MKRRVVITGVGLMNSCGEGRHEFWKNVREARSGLRVLETPERDPLAVNVAGVMPDFKGRKHIANRKSLKVMCRDIQIAVSVSSMARQDAALEGYDPERSGVCIGAGLFDHDLSELADCFKQSTDGGGVFDAKLFGEVGMSQLFPLWLLKYLPNMPACHISVAHELRGPSNTVTLDGSGSAAAFEEAYNIIERGTADVMFAGGAESKLNPSGILRYHLMSLLRQNTSDAQYPVFTNEANGLVLGEGGCILILEELEHALKRQAPIYAEVLSVFNAINTDGREESELKNASRAYAIESALTLAKLNNQHIGRVHLHANGVPREDKAEAVAIDTIFKHSEVKPNLVASKGYTGYMGFASAVTELALAAMSLREQAAVPTLATGTSLLEKPYAFSTSQDAGVDTILVNHFSSGLTNHVVVLKRWEKTS